VGRRCVGPTCGFAASPEVSLGVTVGTLQTRYPGIESIKSRQGVGRGFTCCHVSYSSGPHLPVKVGSDATMCPVAPDLASLSRWAPMLPCVPQLHTSPPRCDGLWCCHMARCSGPHLPIKESFSTATCPTVPDTASLWGRVLALPHVSWLSVYRGTQV
jgi:hypothetical protein